jgi:hypothetical protein
MNEVEKLIAGVEHAEIQALVMDTWQRTDPVTGERHYSIPLLMVTAMRDPSKDARIMAIRYGQAFDAMHRELLSTPAGVEALRSIMAPLVKLLPDHINIADYRPADAPP